MAGILLRPGFTRVEAEPSLHKRSEGKDQVALLVNVGNVVMSGSEANVATLTEQLQAEFAMTAGL